MLNTKARLVDEVSRAILKKKIQLIASRRKRITLMFKVQFGAL